MEEDCPKHPRGVQRAANISCSRCGTRLVHVLLTNVAPGLQGDVAAGRALSTLRAWEPTYVCNVCQRQDQPDAKLRESGGA